MTVHCVSALRLKLNMGVAANMFSGREAAFYIGLPSSHVLYDL
jgi:hypothetical protein